MRSIALPRLDSRAWVTVGAGAAVLLLALTWLLFVGPTRAESVDLRQSAADVQTQNAVLASQNTALEQRAEDRRGLGQELSAALAGLPPSARIPVFSRQVADQAARRKVDLTGFSVGAPTVPGASGSAADVTAATAPLLAIPVTLTATGPASAQLAFLHDLQQIGPRLALVTSTSLAPGQGATESGSIEASSSLTVQLTVFTHRLPSATRDQVAGLLGDAKR